MPGLGLDSTLCPPSEPATYSVKHTADNLCRSQQAAATNDRQMGGMHLGHNTNMGPGHAGLDTTSFASLGPWKLKESPQTGERANSNHMAVD